MQERVAQNLSRIEELRAEAAALEAGSPCLPPPRAPLGLELRAPSVQPAGAGRTSAVAAAPCAAPAQHAWSAERGQAPHGSCWVPAALGSALAAQSIVAVEVEGVPWALFRDAQGQAAAIKDECAHRACPLSLVRAPWSGLLLSARSRAPLGLPCNSGGLCGCAGQGGQRPCAVSLPWCASPPRQCWCLPAGAARIHGASCAGLSSDHAQGGSMKLGAHAWPCHPQHSCRGSAWTRRPLQKLMASSGSCRLALTSRGPDRQGYAGHVHSRLTTR